MMAFKDPQLEDHFNYIADTFKPMDGGNRQHKLRQMIEKLEQVIEDRDDQYAVEIVQLVGQFSRMIKVANGEI